jgi:hypothetical protein
MNKKKIISFIHYISFILGTIFNFLKTLVQAIESTAQLEP